MTETLEINRCSVRLEFNDNTEREKALTPFCIAVIREFELPGKRICVYVAASEDGDFSNPTCLYYQGKYFRGFHTPPEGLHQLPKYLDPHIFRSDEELMWLDHVASFDEQLLIDHLIYIKE